MSVSHYLLRSQWALLLALLAAGCNAKAKQAADSQGERKTGIEVPPGAELIANEKGNIARIAMGRGTIYVVDSMSGQVLHAGAIDFGQKVILYPQGRQLLINGVVVPGVEIDPQKAYRIYFAKG